MAHFAQLNESNIVLQVIVVHNNETHDENGVESELQGIQFCQSLFGENTRWLQTSYNASIRKNYAGIGYTFDSNRDAFIPPKSFPSWVLSEDTCLWESPVPYPDDGNRYSWDEETISWKEILVEDLCILNTETTSSSLVLSEDIYISSVGTTSGSEVIV